MIQRYEETQLPIFLGSAIHARMSSVLWRSGGTSMSSCDVDKLITTKITSISFNPETSGDWQLPRQLPDSRLTAALSECPRWRVLWTGQSWQTSWLVVFCWGLVPFAPRMHRFTDLVQKMEQRFLRETKCIDDTEVLSLINLFFSVSRMSLIPSLSKRQAVPSTEHLEVLYSNFLHYLLIHIPSISPHHPPTIPLLFNSLINCFLKIVLDALSISDTWYLLSRGITHVCSHITHVLTHELTHKHTHKSENVRVE